MRGAWTLGVACLVGSIVARADVAPPAEPPPELLVLTIGTVRASPTRPGGSEWDDAKPVRNLNAICGLVALGANVFVPGSGAPAAGVCQVLGAEGQQQRRPQMPDLVVALDGGSGTYRTPVAQDVGAVTFRSRFQVPVASIPSGGLRLQVLDDDGSAGEELIGELRVQRDDLLAALASGQPMELRDDTGAVQKVEIAVTKKPRKVHRKTIKFDTKQKVTAMNDLPIDAGTLVFIEASGDYIAGPQAGKRSVEGRAITPGQYASDNLFTPPFDKAPHGAAIALVGSGVSVKPLVVGNCVGYIVQTPGTIALGVNDNHVENNEGAIDFKLTAFDSNPKVWARAGELVPCTVMTSLLGHYQGPQPGAGSPYRPSRPPPQQPQRGSQLRSPFE